MTDASGLGLEAAHRNSTAIALSGRVLRMRPLFPLAFRSAFADALIL